MAGGSMRASDDDRERVVDILREHTAQGRLTLEEFEERMSRAYAAKTWEDLRPLTYDLPVQVDEGPPREEGVSKQPTTEPSHARRVAASWGLRLAPLVAILLVIGVVASVAGGSAARFAPLAFIGIFWATCGRGCRPRSRNHL